MLKIFIISGICAIMITSCNGIDLESQRKYLEELEESILTNREIFFCDSLEKIGYSNINLNIPIIGIVGRGESFYILEATPPFELTENNLDSVKSINFEIAKTLYSSVIEDSIIKDIGTLEVIFFIRNPPKNGLIRFRKKYEKSDFRFSIHY